MLSVSLNPREREALQSLDPFLYKLYVHAIRSRMDYQTGVVGIKYKFSYSTLIKDMYVPSQPGVLKIRSGYPSKSKIARGLAALERTGLITQLQRGALVFECNLSSIDDVGKFSHRQAGTRPVRETDTQADTQKREEKLKQSTAKMIDRLKGDTQAEHATMPDADTIYPYTGKDKDILFNTSCSVKKPAKEKKALQSVDLPIWLSQRIWDDFVTHRKAIKKPLTQRAAELSLEKLAELREKGNDPVEVIKQSILCGYTGLFELKRSQVYATQFNRPQSKSEIFDNVISGAFRQP
jgi:hypothetical protein